MRFEASCCTKQELWTARILPFSSLSNTPLNVRIHTEIRYRHELSIFHHQDWYFLWQMSYSFLGKWRKVKQTELGEKQWDSPTREQMLSCSLKRDRLLGSSASLCWPYPHMILQFYFFIFFFEKATSRYKMALLSENLFGPWPPCWNCKQWTFTFNCDGGRGNVHTCLQ